MTADVKATTTAFNPEKSVKKKRIPAAANIRTDTVGAIAGGLAGLYYGYVSIPEDWLSAIKRREWIEEMCEIR